MTIFKPPCDCRAGTLIVSGIDGYKCKRCGAYASSSSEGKRLQKDKECSEKIATLEHELAICINALRDVQRVYELSSMVEESAELWREYVYANEKTAKAVATALEAVK